MAKLIYPEESYTIMGACFNVYKEMGPGFLEAVYQECLQIEFEKKAIPFESQKELDLYYQGQQLQQKYKADFVCHKKIIIELKSLNNIANEHRAQIINYLKATKFQLGLLINFSHHPKLEYERFIFDLA
jgi:GxxExxY protein